MSLPEFGFAQLGKWVISLYKVCHLTTDAGVEVYRAGSQEGNMHVSW